MNSQSNLILEDQTSNGKLQPLKTLSSVLKLDQSAEDWNLNTTADAEEDGRREYLASVSFVAPFNTVPVVHLGLTGFDIDNGESARITVVPMNITANGFTVKVETWARTRVYSVDINWLAIG